MSAFNSQLSAFISSGIIAPETGAILQNIGDCLLNSIINGDFAVVKEDNTLNTTFFAHPAQMHIPNDLSQIDFRLYPNPSQGNITLDIEDYLNQQISISIFNTLGHEVYRLPDQVVQSPLLSMDLSNRSLPNGVYLLSLKTIDGRQIKQFVMAR